MNELQINNQTTEVATLEVVTKKWELLQRRAQAYSRSSLVPTQYRAQVEKKEGYNTVLVNNPSGISNCVIAIDIADRMKANELMVMQNLSIIQGKPSWSSQWVIAMINGCGKFSSLRFKIEDLGDKEVDYVEYVWKDKQSIPVQKKITIHDFSCVAYATEKSTGDVFESTKVTIEMAVKEGWYLKNGSKWQTMPELMLRYRSASFFGSIYVPELKMGLHTVEENQDSSPINLEEKHPHAIVAEVVEENAPKKFKPKKAVETNVPVDITDISNESKVIVNEDVDNLFEEI